MKRTISILSTFLVASLCFAQENSQNRAVLLKFDKYFNTAKYDSIHLMFSPETQTKLPLKETNKFLGNLKNSYGNIISRTYLENQAPFTVYKTTLEKGVLKLNFAVDDNGLITGVFAQPYIEDKSPKIERNLTKMQLPFKGEWTIFWGGDTKELNGHHTGVKFQKNAFDILQMREDKTYRTTGKTNDDYYAFNQEIVAPCDAEVVQAVDGVKDNIPGAVNPLLTLGNSVILKTKNNEFILLAHLKQGSVKVKQGNTIKKGDLIGLCGNSGNSSEPHLHFQLQNIEELAASTGVKCYFENILVNSKEMKDYSPVKGEKVRNNGQ